MSTTPSPDASPASQIRLTIGFDPSTCRHVWSHAPTVGYYQCVYCRERHDYGTPKYLEIERGAALATTPSPDASPDSGERLSVDWCLNMARLEGGHEIGAGALDHPLRVMCERPPAGWTCSRLPGHDGPCAASPSPAIVKTLVARLLGHAHYDEDMSDALRKSLRQAAAVLSAAIVKEAGEVERLLHEGEWFYPEGDHSSDECRFSPDEVIDYALEGENVSRVVAIERAAALPTVYAAVRVYSDAEKDARGSDDEYDYTLFATAEEARAALSASNAAQVSK